jgi:thiol-disulfide isomerase/thioredoxin
MKSYILRIVVTFVFGIFLFMLIGIYSKIHLRNILSNSIECFPSFSFKTMSDSIFNSNQIKHGPVLIIYFHPECEHCQYEINDLIENNVPIPNLQILLITYAPKESVIEYLTELNYNGNLILPLLDETFSFGKYFGSDMVPSTYIYDEELKLIDHFDGEVGIETIHKLFLKR